VAGRLVGLQRHLDLIATHLETIKNLPRIKNQVGRYLKGLAGGSAIRARIYNCRTFSELSDLVNESIGHAAG